MSKTRTIREGTQTLELEMSQLEQLLAVLLSTRRRRTRKPRSAYHGRYLHSTTKRFQSATMRTMRTRRK
jgi:hypothetical protein